MSAPSTWPAEHPTVDTIAEQIPALRAQLHRAGVPAQDMEDILQEILVGAIMAIREDRYRPDPAREPRKVLRHWLAGVAYRQIGHFNTCAFRKREIPVGTAEHPDAATPPASAEVIDVLRALAKLRPELREIVKLIGQGWRNVEIAVLLSIPLGTASSRVRAARRALRRKGW